MERITKRIDEKHACYAICEKECPDGIYADNQACMCTASKMAAKRLLEYEDTGLTPEQIVEQTNAGWIPVEERLPECEKEVYIQTERGNKTTAIYEDGTMREEDSIWFWCDLLYGEWDEERDCMIIPEGWWEYRHFNPDDVYNNVVDEKVVAWRPLPESYIADN